MKPAIQPELLGHRWPEGVRYHQSIRLNRAVDLRSISANHQTGGGQPGRNTLPQGAHAISSENQLRLRRLDLIRRIELVIAQRPIDRFVKDLNVGQQLQQRRRSFEFVPEQINFATQHRNTLGEFGAVRIRDLDSGRWNPPDAFRQIVRRSIRQQPRLEQKQSRGDAKE